VTQSGNGTAGGTSEATDTPAGDGDAADAPLIALPARLDGSEAEPLRQTLLAALARGAAISLDGTQPELVSTGCVQVILSAMHSAQAAKLDFEVKNASAALVGAIADLGLETEFSAKGDRRG